MTAATPTRWGIAVPDDRHRRLSDDQRLAIAIDRYHSQWGLAPTVVHVPPDKVASYQACTSLLVMGDENIHRFDFFFVKPEEVSS